jgi:N-acetylglucosamine kinase-like BadF-type ATPase
MELKLGISGGHQRSTAVAISGGRVIACATGEGLNLHTVQHLKVADRLGQLLDALAENMDLTTTEVRHRTGKLILALPGAATGFDQQIAETCLILNGWKDRTKYKVVDDTWAGLIGGRLDRRGICAFAGTGASVFVGLGDFPQGKTCKIDGWGPILGDFGSGFQLAMDMFRFIGRAFDRGYVPPLFSEVMQIAPKIGSIDNVQHWFDQLYIVHPDDWRIRFAQLATAVTRAANRDDEPDLDAVKLVNQSAEQMSETIRIAIQRFSPASEQLPIVFQGGMFEHSRLYREIVTTRIKEYFPNSVKMSLFRTVVGAGIMACADNDVIPPSMECENIVRSIDFLHPREKAILKYTDSQGPSE